jgi:hypothetical protein
MGAQNRFNAICWLALLQVLGCGGEQTGSTEQNQASGGVASVGVPAGGASGAGGSSSDPGAAGSVTAGGGDTSSTTMDGSVTILEDDGGVMSSCDGPAFLQSHCDGMGCHQTPMPAASLDLVSDGVATRLVDVTSASCVGWKLVVAGSAEQSFLYQKVALQMPQCGLQMPVAMALTNSETQCIRDWIVGLAGNDPPPPCETCGTTVCVDLQSDPMFCGDCQTSCADSVCASGVCQGCPTDQTACNGECVDVLSDTNNCGDCGNGCGGGEECINGECQCAASGNVSFSSDVAPLLDQACANAGCHTGARPKEGLNLEAMKSYQGLVGVASTQCSPERLLVDPGSGSTSYLMDKILGRNLCLGTVMPKGAGVLTQSELDSIGAWICAGAPDN